MPAASANAGTDKASLVNEQSSVGLVPAHGKLLVRQIAGLIARRIVTDHPVGSTVHQGERLGMIRFGSRVDVFMPRGTTVRVKVGDTTRVGETVHRRVGRVTARREPRRRRRSRRVVVRDAERIHAREPVLRVLVHRLRLQRAVHLGRAGSSSSPASSTCWTGAWHGSRNTGTEFGAELDSLVDVISFGVAPALLIYFLEFSLAGRFAWLLCYIYVVAVALRLARYNVTAASKPHSHWFTGMPSPSAGMTLATYYPFSQTRWYQQSLAYLDLQHQGLVVLMLLLAVLMVSNVSTRASLRSGSARFAAFSACWCTSAFCSAPSSHPRRSSFRSASAYVTFGLVADRRARPDGAGRGGVRGGRAPRRMPPTRRSSRLPFSKERRRRRRHFGATD